MSSTKQVPSLRFIGFTDAWEQREVGELMEVTSVRRIHQSDWKNEGIRFLRARDIVAAAKNEEVSDYLYISEEKYEECSKISGKVEIGDLLVTGVGTIGVPYLISNNSPIYFKDGNIIWFKNNGAINGPFLYFSFVSDTIQNFITESAGIGTVGTYTIETGKKTPIVLPSYQEQQKIGGFFRDLDDLITLHQRKYDQLVNIKKSMLEKMFPKKGELVPEVRFAGFTDAWEQRKAKDICSISTGKSNTQDSIDEGLYPFYVRSAIIERSNRYLFDEEAVLTVGDGVGTGKVFHYVNGKYDLHQRVYRMFSFTEDVSAKYFYYFFSTHFYARVMSMTAKTSVDSVRLEMIADMDIQHPNKQEQLLISGFFDNLDNLITLHQRKYERLQNLKKAYLERMFV